MFGLKVRVDEFTELVPSGEHDPHPRDADGKTPLHYATEPARWRLPSVDFQGSWKASSGPVPPATNLGNTCHRD